MMQFRRPPAIVSVSELTVSVIPVISDAAIFVEPSYCLEPAISTDLRLIVKLCVPPVSV